ncbi:late competence development ComFB family protein [Ureibacillus acetophenoni]|uniref:Competence protein ComFB n=1 Tax=Ureibacillus acetophenoni TaxID=614649 RepID=A0A285UJL5_9BACL|nr:late competence development ComFB family protein [Ureibacillus acetophenoni]SOC42039.1 competence protein ComFB [Ureibacillus acetophenoni]
MAKPILVNVTEEIVRGLVRFLLFGPEYQTFCHCENCEMNIVANALNKLPSNYVSSVSKREEAFNKLNNSIYISIVNKEIIRSIHLVGKKPGHD